MAGKTEGVKINRLKVVLAEIDMSQKEFSEKWGKSVTAVSQICLNNRQPSLWEFPQMAEILDVPMRELIIDE